MVEIGTDTLILTHDTLIQGTHVRMDEDPADIAWKLVAVNLSDLAAKGAAPRGVLVSHMLGEGDERFLTGLGEVLAAHDVPLLGGDTVRAAATQDGPRSWGCTALGLATSTPVPDRRGAQVGDGVFVTGTLGLAMLGLDDRGSGSAADFAYRRPQPLLAEGQALAPRVHAMMDVSDGLLLDCWRIASASRCAIALDSAAVPVADPGRRDACMRWGDDYQLLFTASPETALPVPATRIGTVTQAGEAALTLDGAALNSDHGIGYQH